ncbi:uncharacterized protein [Clytia hemisphaerica]|uniref:uncharacterized protein n=1 Tax=Clytia hemisphaerica TaxID=252671 RepID=UPI0034D69017
MHKLIPESKSTYYSYKSVKSFVLRMFKNPYVADGLAQSYFEVIRLLQEPDCRILPNLIVDYNYVEVKKGYYFNIREKKFENNPQLKGSLRSFVNYDHRAIPNPKPFIEGIENSFPNPAIRKEFLVKYYQILLHQQFPKKEAKLILVDPPDSGKSSWFCPMEGLVPSKFISCIVPDGRFSAADVNKNTQVIVMDEWTPESLSCEDAKRILQGNKL